MAELIYALCAVTSTLCAVLLLLAHRTRKTQLLFYGSLGFAGLALNNIILFVDLVIVPASDYSTLRSAVALAGMLALIHGLVKEIR